MDKKGELTSGQIVTLVLAILGFIIVVLLLVSLSFDSYSDTQVCKLSVLSRATLSNTVNELVPLKCVTQKYCLNEGSGDCNQFVGEKQVSSVPLTGTSQQKAETVDKTVANAMYDCWDQMGQGKLDLFNGVEDPSSLGSQAWSFLNLEPKATSCVICSRIGVSNDVDDINSISQNIDVNNYLATHVIPGTNSTYLQEFTDGAVNSYSGSFRENLSKKNTKNNTNQIAVVFMQILTGEKPVNVFEKNTITAGSFLFLGSSFMGPLKGGVVAGIGGLAAGTIGAAGQYEHRQVSAAYCGGLTGKAGNPENGCSIVTTVNYDNIQELNKLCGRIEGSP